MKIFLRASIILVLALCHVICCLLLFLFWSVFCLFVCLVEVDISPMVFALSQPHTFHGHFTEYSYLRSIKGQYTLFWLLQLPEKTNKTL